MHEKPHNPPGDDDDFLSGSGSGDDGGRGNGGRDHGGPGSGGNGSNRDDGKGLELVIGVAVGAVVLGILIAVAVIIYCRRRKQRREASNVMGLNGQRGQENQNNTPSSATNGTKQSKLPKKENDYSIPPPPLAGNHPRRLAPGVTNPTYEGDYLEPESHEYLPMDNSKYGQRVTNPAYDGGNVDSTEAHSYMNMGDISPRSVINPTYSGDYVKPESGEYEKPNSDSASGEYVEPETYTELQDRDMNREYLEIVGD